MVGSSMMRGRAHGGGSPTWRDEVRLRISQEAEGVRRSPPPCFRRFDGFTNQDHPSIFKGRHVAAATTPSSLPQLPSPATAAIDNAGSSGGEPVLQLQAARDDGMATGRDIVVAAVGPYHHHLSARAPPPLITRAKKCCIVMFLVHRFGLDDAAFLGWVRGNEDQARRCYERDSFQMSAEALAEMLLLDACLVLFAVFLLRTSVRVDQRPAELAKEETEHGRNYIYLSADITLHTKQTRLDLLMLDNQIPFFVLSELHRRLKGTLFENIDHSIEELALSCFDDIHPSCSTTLQDGHAHHGGAFPPRVHHLLHLFHWSRVPRGKHMVGISSIVPKEPEPHLPSATELKESLTRFNKSHRPCYSLDISFRRETLGVCGVMSIPELRVHGYSDSIFRSLIAFEQNHLRCGLGVTAYSMCMARLLQSEADVKVLRKRGIITHTHKTDKEIVQFFSDLRDEYADTCMPEDLLALCKNVEAHRRSRAGRVVEAVGRQCFPRQTVTFFVIVGTIISISTLVNTIHSMYRYYHPYKGINPS